METPQRYTFNKRCRLKSRSTIELLFKTGKSFSGFPFKVYWLFSTGEDWFLQAGFGVSAKQFKKAVDRNRIKRLMKEAWRLQKNALDQKLKDRHKHLAVFFIYVGNEIPDHQLVVDKTGDILKRLLKITDENCLADT